MSPLENNSSDYGFDNHAANDSFNTFRGDSDGSRSQDINANIAMKEDNIQTQLVTSENFKAVNISRALMGFLDNSSISGALLSGEADVGVAAPSIANTSAGDTWTIQPFLTNVTFNATHNATHETPDVLGPEYEERIRQIVLGIMFIMAVIGNHRVVWKLREKWAKRGRMTTMAFNLTMADIFVTYFSLLGQLIWELIDRRWYLPNFACKLFKFFQTFSMTSSNFMLVAIAIDRHEAVLRPLNAFISSRNLALATWTISLLPALPSLYMFIKVETEDGQAYCVSKFYTNDLSQDIRQVYMATILGTVFIMPLFLLLVLYLRIYIEIWRKNAHFFKNDLSNDSRRNNNPLPKARTKTLKMTIVITATFFITNLPYIIQELIFCFYTDSMNQYIIALFGIISASNSCFNPFIYLFFSPKDSSPSNGSYRVTFTRRSTSSYQDEQQSLNGGSTVARSLNTSIPLRERPWT